jgi:hypothetical protein
MRVCLLVNCLLLLIDYNQTPSSQGTSAKPPSITFKMHVAGVRVPCGKAVVQHAANTHSSQLCKWFQKYVQ